MKRRVARSAFSRWFNHGAALAAFVTVAVACPGVAAATPVALGTTGVEIAAPGTGGANVFLESVSCPASGACSAIGRYEDSSKRRQALLVSESNGVWTAASELTLPEGAAERPEPRLRSVSCAAPGTCSAVGFYEDSSKHVQAMVVSESAGVWSAAITPTLPQDAALPQAYAELRSVSCAVPGSCSAVGSYIDSSGHTQAMVISESGGAWSAADELTLPQGAGEQPVAQLSSVSCATPGSCSAVGYYLDSSSERQAMLASESSGVWGAASELALPQGAAEEQEAELLSVSCAAPGSCAAVGSYEDSSNHRQGMLVSESNRVWAPALELALPPGSAEQPAVYLAPVSCAAVGFCSAVGSYSDSFGTQAMVVSESEGVWSAASKPALPQNAAEHPEAELSSLSCAAPGFCSAVGHYDDSSGFQPGMVISESAGAWAAASEPTLPEGAAEAQNTALDSVSCAAAGSCSAVGYYKDASGVQGLAIAGAPQSEKAPETTPPGSASSSAATVTNSSTTPTASLTTPTALLAPAVPVITLRSSILSASKSYVTARITCAAATCTGTLRLTRQTTVTYVKANRKMTLHRTIVLATSSYRLSPGTTQILKLHLTRLGQSALAHAGKRHPLRGATLTVTLGSAKTIAHAVLII